MFKGIGFLFKYAWKFQKSYVIYSFLLQFVNSIIPLVSIIMPKFIIDELINQKRIEYLVFYVGILLVTIFFGALLSNYFYTQSFLKRNLLFLKFQIFLSEKISNTDFENLEKPHFLDLKEKANKFLYADGQGFCGVLDKFIGIIGKSFTFIGIMAIIATLNVFIVLLMVLLVLLSSFFNSNVKKANIKRDLEKTPHERKNTYYQNLFSDFSYGKEIRMYSLNHWLMKKYTSQLHGLNEFYKKSIKSSKKTMDFSAFTAFLQQLVSYGYIIIMVLRNIITIGDFTMYLSAISTFSSSMHDVMDSVVDIKRFGMYYDAVEEYMNFPSSIENDGKHVPTKNNMDIVFEHVYFKYSSQDTYALQDICIHIKTGEKLSIVGENGSGKTTFIKLLTRLYKPTSGKILLNGIDINEYDYKEYMSLFSAVFQDYKLFSFSLKENIALADTENSEVEILKDVLQKSGFNKELQYGLDTAIYKNFDETGFEPSGGEGQKIAMARALYKDANFIILDEPTAALDPRAEYEIYQSFHKMVNKKTAVFISHRMSSSKFCDKVAVINNGRIIEYGTHAELINNNSQYSELFNMQAQFYVDDK